MILLMIGLIFGLGLYKLKEIVPLKYKPKLEVTANWSFIFCLGALAGIGYMMVSVG